MLEQPLARILRIILEPQLRSPEAKTIPPGIHIRHEPMAADPVDFISKHYLQIADRRFFEIIATRIAVELLTALLRHANGVASLMQQRMNGRIAAYVNVATDNARFLITPETSGNRMVAPLQVKCQVILRQQFLKSRQRQISDDEYVFFIRGQTFTTKKFA
jgi:hypothetical protein